MNFPKDKIQKNFDRASVTYDGVSSVQKTCAHRLVELIQQHAPSLNPQVILDLGTGTGCMSKALLSVYPNSHYYLNDLAPQMLIKAQENLTSYSHAHIDYLLEDMEAREYAVLKPDLVVSNLSLQWIDQIKPMITRVFETTDTLAFTYPLWETFQEWGQMFQALSLPQPIYEYWTQDQWDDFLPSLHPQQYFRESRQFTLFFQHARDFMVYLRHLGANQSYQPLSRQALKQVLRTYNQPFTMTYWVLLVVLKRSSGELQ